MAFLPIPLVKMSGAGNTFVIVDATKTSTWQGIEEKLRIKRKPFAQMLCDITLGVAADGVLFLEDGSEDSNYKWDFYNADGSAAEMCGNAARCAALFANKYLSSSVTGNYKFQTGAGPVSAQVLGDDRVRVIMPVVKDFQPKKILSMSGKAEEFFFVNTGVPHLVRKVNTYAEIADLKEFARTARHHADLG
ncbi:MAG: diaminopimelate epimerase, partial [Proteobacteria bacterium]